LRNLLGHFISRRRLSREWCFSFKN